MRRGSEDTLHLFNLPGKLLVIWNALAGSRRGVDRAMRLRPEQTFLNILALSLTQGHRNDKRRHTRTHTENRNKCDERDHRLLALGTKVTRRDKEFEFHGVVG